MAMLAFYAGLLIGVVAGMVLMALISMRHAKEEPHEAKQS
jgi:hypothetical protein